MISGIADVPNASIEVACRRIRHWAEPRWKEWRDLADPYCELPLPAGICGPAAVLLREALAAAVPSLTWFSTGGEADPAGGVPCGGMVPSDGWRHEAHSWAEGVRQDGSRLIADITADQFGYGDVVVTDAGDSRYRRTYPLSRTPMPGMLCDTTGLAWAADYALSRNGADISVRVHTGPAIGCLRDARRETIRILGGIG
jgi:hypothetical protein